VRRRTFVGLTGAAAFDSMFARTPSDTPLTAEPLAPVLTGHVTTKTSGDGLVQVPDIDTLATAVDNARRQYQACSYADLIKHLPALEAFQAGHAVNRQPLRVVRAEPSRARSVPDGAANRGHQRSITGTEEPALTCERAYSGQAATKRIWKPAGRSESRAALGMPDTTRYHQFHGHDATA
jgi:hypothetical protein